MVFFMRANIIARAFESFVLITLRAQLIAHGKDSDRLIQNAIEENNFRQFEAEISISKEKLPAPAHWSGHHINRLPADDGGWKRRSECVRSFDFFVSAHHLGAYCSFIWLCVHWLRHHA